MSKIYCLWDWVIPGMYIAQCLIGKPGSKNDVKIWLPERNQVKIDSFKHCPYCGSRIRRNPPSLDGQDIETYSVGENFVITCVNARRCIVIKECDWRDREIALSFDGPTLKESVLNISQDKLIAKLAESGELTEAYILRIVNEAWPGFIVQYGQKNFLK